MTYNVTIKPYRGIKGRIYTLWRWGECPGYPNKQAEWRMRQNGTWYKTPFVRFVDRRD